MDDPKNFASLSPTLLARKGGAKPAMRPQIAPLVQFDGAAARQVEEDLGWNDHGDDDAPHGDVVQFAPEIPPALPAIPPVPVVPEVVRQQEAIAERVAARASRPRRSALASGRRAAFTLRVDAERHLKLRLACTLDNRSAQQLVTEALDRLLDELPGVAELAAQARKTN